MKLYCIRFGYIHNKTHYERLREDVTSIVPEANWKDWPEDRSYHHPSDDQHIITARQLADLREAKVEIEVLHSTDLDFQRLVKQESVPVARDVHYNYRVEAHASNSALHSYNEVLLLTDSCTDRLQDHLDAGWRIVAVCPQPDQRRPDYILGRYTYAKEQQA